MTDPQQPKPPAVNNFGACDGFDLWVDVFSHSISDADTFHADLLKARVRAMKYKRAHTTPAVTLELRTGQWSVDADMTPTRARALAAALIEAAAFAAVLLSGPALDDRSDEWAQADALADAQKAARSEYLRERAAAQLCMKLHGPGTAYRWTDSGDLVCTDHRTGRAAVVVASKGGAL